MTSQRMKDYWASAATYDQAEEYWPEPKEPCPLCGGEADWCPVCEGANTTQLTAAWARICEQAQINSLRRRAIVSKSPGTCSACEQRCPDRRLRPNRVAPCYCGPMAGPELLPVEPPSVESKGPGVTPPAGLADNERLLELLAEGYAKSVNHAFWEALVAPGEGGRDRWRRDFVALVAPGEGGRDRWRRDFVADLSGLKDNR
jgi:hypothetical protein